MILMFAAAVCVILLVAIGRVVIDYSGQSDQLSTTVKAHQRLIDEHQREAKAFETRAKAARREIHTLSRLCSDVDGQIQEQLATLEEVQLQLERRRPKARQVDKDRDPDDEGPREQSS